MAVNKTETFQEQSLNCEGYLQESSVFECLGRQAIKNITSGLVWCVPTLVIAFFVLRHCYFMRSIPYFFCLLLCNNFTYQAKESVRSWMVTSLRSALERQPWIGEW